MNIYNYIKSFGSGQKKQSPYMRVSSGKMTKRDIDDVMNIVNKITKSFVDRSRKDIQKWRQAIKIAENPEKPRLYIYHDLINDLMTDGHLQAQIQLRENATLNTEFYIKREDGTINDEATEIIRQEWFYEFLKEAIGAKLRGTKVLQFTSFGGKHISFEIIPQRNTVPVLKLVIPDLSKEEGIRYDDPYFENWLIQIGKDKDLGILNNVVPNLIWKRNVLQAWAEFCEKFGLPMVTATTNKYDQETISKIDYMLRKLAMASRGVFPEGSKVEYKEANRTDAYQTFDKFCKRNNEEISKPIVGGTMLTDDGSSKSQSEVHERNIDKKIAVADKRHLTFLVNDCLLPILRNQGYTEIGKNDKFEFDQGHALELTEYWTITQGVMQEYEVDPEWISKTFSIPITGKKKSPAPTLPITQALTRTKVSGVLLPNYPVDKCCPVLPHARSGSFEKAIKNLTRQLLTAVWEEDNTLPARAQLIALEARELVKGLFEGWGERRLEIAYNAPDHLALQLMEHNLFEFATSKTEARLASVSQLLIDKDALQIRSKSDFFKEAEKITTDFNRTWLETEYNLSISVGQNAANYVRFMDEKDTVTSLVQYSTAGDNKVRSEHQLLEGRVFDLNDSEAMDLFPPNGYNCRCEFQQYLGGSNTVISKGSTAKKLLGDSFKDSQFDVNRGDTKQVFTKEQYYHDIKGLNGNLKKMDYKDNYGLKDWKDFKADLDALPIDSTISKNNVAELFQVDGSQGGDFMGFKDHLKRQLILKKNTFSKQTDSTTKARLFPHIEKVLKNPDEVYLHSHNPKKGSFQTRYVKFYNDRMMVVDTRLGNNNMEITNWEGMTSKESTVRNGLLIQKRQR
ncbi:phage head morphogenesis protein [Aquimarina latercula]|uniref:phage head morphogenesis protein n=1 Tax=Aquimarina latercula TaxID=987 RepID=UPI0003FB2498|nr:phage head morphogenesis protein [Aquimarina latercula]